MHLHELMDQGDLAAMEDQGYIDVRPHPQLPLAIINYTKQCAWERKWNAVTNKCRGLIYNYRTMEVVARPFEKFFNYEEIAAGLTDMSLPSLDTRVKVSDKMDGSLGIIYPDEFGGYAVATRGSFTSDQALHATAVLRSQYRRVEYMPGATYLVEIIYPENRVVLDYGTLDDLVLIGGVINETGTTFGPVDAELMLVNWNGPVARTYYAPTLRDALALPPRHNAEGIVIRVEKTGEMIKLKQDDYVELHRIVTGMTDRTIWEQLGEGKDPEEIKAPLPEEFHSWVDQVTDDLYARAREIIVAFWEEHTAVKRSLPKDWTRKDFAIAVQDSPNRAFHFMYLDGKPIWDVVWKSLKPAAGRSMKTIEED